MLKSLYSGVSGMKGFQTKLDVIGNNIANVNTVGFKKSRVVFQDILNQNISGATAPGNSGGINPKQVGLGTTVAAIDTLHTPGSPMTTGVGTDLTIDGDAFFVVSPTGSEPRYLTKAGNFTRDAEGNLVDASGNFVLGVTGNSDDETPVKISIPSDKFTSYSIDANGYINVVDKDGKSGKLNGNGNLSTGDTNLISLATAVVSNPGGLEKIGGTLFQTTPNSNTGDLELARIEENGGGTINAGVLEMSNVDLTEEFTELIIAQRGFQANSRTITTSDSILEEVVNLKR